MPQLPQTPSKPPFEEWYRRGRRVRLVHDFGPPSPAMLLEDRGMRAAKQTKHLVRIATHPDDPDERLEFEVSEDRILLDAA